MTTREEKRFTAAVACLQGLLSGNHYKGSERLHMCVTMAVPLADDLLNALDKTAPPTSLNFKCQHVIYTERFSKTITRGECPMCHEVLP